MKWTWEEAIYLGAHKTTQEEQKGIGGDCYFGEACTWTCLTIACYQCNLHPSCFFQSRDKFTFPSLWDFSYDGCLYCLLNLSCSIWIGSIKDTRKYLCSHYEELSCQKKNNLGICQLPRVSKNKLLCNKISSRMSAENKRRNTTSYVCKR